MKHDFQWDIAGANEMCLSCDNCNPKKCTWVDHNEMYKGTIHDKDKIYLCPNFTKDRKVIGDYEKHIADGYVQAINEYQKLKKMYRKESATASRARTLKQALKNIMEIQG